jgi:hypothetical protein
MLLVTKILLSIAFLLLAVKPVSGAVVVADASANVTKYTISSSYDLRAVRLKLFLDKYNSPLANHAGRFVYWADVYNVDWRLVPAITGVESTFGKRIPQNSYNAYGWANGAYRFTSWDNSIEHVTKVLRTKYIDRGATSIDKIARIYAPPSSTWSGNVKFFVNKIDSTPLEFDL